jgi:hypothetical protein
MSLARLLIVSVIILVSQHCEAQTDSTVQSLQHLSTKYITTVDNKIEKYSHRLSSKTEKTLVKLSRWENKIHSLLQKVNPEAAQKLFGEGQTTFSNLLQKLKEGKSIAEQYKTQYDEYRDKLTTNLKYLQQQKEKLDDKLVKPVQEASKKVTELEQDVQNSEALEQFIKERKKQLLDESLKYIGKSKYLTKINKEAYYYVETLRNYKAIFSDKQKAEETALTILNKIPAFQKFVQQNSMLSSLFRMPGNGNTNNAANLAGLQTRAQMNSLIQERIAAGGPNAQAQIQQNIQQAQDELNKLKDKVLKSGNSSSDAELPPMGARGLNMQKTKTFKQRLEFGSNLQFAKNNSLVPTTADIGLSLGYKLNDKSVIGLGASYKMGLGSIQHISITHQGLGLRSFVDWKLKKQFFISGGYEMNRIPGIDGIQNLFSGSRGAWQQSGLIGISKKIAVKTKFFKGTKLQLLYDMLHSQHVPVSQPVLFRIGYDFK